VKKNIKGRFVSHKKLGEGGRLGPLGTPTIDFGNNWLFVETGWPTSSSFVQIESQGGPLNGTVGPEEGYLRPGT
jgi:hypothetical protein